MTEEETFTLTLNKNQISYLVHCIYGMYSYDGSNEFWSENGKYNLSPEECTKVNEMLQGKVNNDF
jgi:hypothetical protein